MTVVKCIMKRMNRGNNRNIHGIFISADFRKKTIYTAILKKKEDIKIVALIEL